MVLQTLRYALYSGQKIPEYLVKVIKKMAEGHLKKEF
jgi:hypothetical protein